MKSPEDSIWTRRTHRTAFADAEDLAYGPSGGRAKQWIAGAILASLPIIYGIHCIQRGHTTLFGSRGSSENLVGSAGISLAIAYISIGAFLHFHYFWGLSDRLWRFSQALKVSSFLVFLPAFFYALYLAFV
jgi:hypothetical protein